MLKSKMIKTLEYYCANGTHLIFNKYTIDITGVIRNNKTRKKLSYSKNKEGYNTCSVIDDANSRCTIPVCRAVASTFHGPPPTLAHTADHINRDRNDDTVDNIRWATKKEQADNRNYPETTKSALIITKDGLSFTSKDWSDYLKDQKNHLGREYTAIMITHYAQRKQQGFSYIEYPDLPNEVWKKIKGSETSQGRWEISNMNRLKYITKYAENVLSGERLGTTNEYPKIFIKGKLWLCHTLAFMTFFPDDWAAKKTDEFILHEEDSRTDFRPHKLRLGTRSDNGKDAHNNGKHDNTKSTRTRCISYVNDVLEKEHLSQGDAVEYLKSIGYIKAYVTNVGRAVTAFRDGKVIVCYGRTWKSCP